MAKLPSQVVTTRVWSEHEGAQVGSFLKTRGKLGMPDSPIYVLVVEDDSLSRLHAVSLVEDAGYIPVEASNADEAITILESRKDIRIVFTDINMPGSMDGLKLAHAIRRRWPPIELILTSGHFGIKDDELPERGRFFPKPYRDEEIISALHHFSA
jgi:CheY-like chemotaxis protein